MKPDQFPTFRAITKSAAHVCVVLGRKALFELAISILVLVPLFILSAVVFQKSPDTIASKQELVDVMAPTEEIQETCDRIFGFKGIWPLSVECGMGDYGGEYPATSRYVTYWGIRSEQICDLSGGKMIYAYDRGCNDHTRCIPQEALDQLSVEHPIEDNYRPFFCDSGPF